MNRREFFQQKIIVDAAQFNIGFLHNFYPYIEVNRIFTYTWIRDKFFFLSKIIFDMVLLNIIDLEIIFSTYIGKELYL